MESNLGGAFKYLFVFTPKIGEDFHFDSYSEGLVQAPTRNHWRLMIFQKLPPDLGWMAVMVSRGWSFHTKNTTGYQETDLVFQSVTNQVPCSKLTWQQKMDLVKMYLLLKMVIFHCYVRLPEGICDCAFSVFTRRLITRLTDFYRTFDNAFFIVFFVSGRFLSPRKKYTKVSVHWKWGLLSFVTWSKNSLTPGKRPSGEAGQGKKIPGWLVFFHIYIYIYYFFVTLAKIGAGYYSQPPDGSCIHQLPLHTQWLIHL